MLSQPLSWCSSRDTDELSVSEPRVLIDAAPTVCLTVHFHLAEFQAMPIHVRTANPTFLDPERLYSLRGFVESSGVSLTRIREASRSKIELRVIRAGKRVFVRGRDGIEFIERLAVAHCHPQIQGDQ